MVDCFKEGFKQGDRRKPTKFDLKRLKLIGEYACGKVLDVGFNEMPNPYLKNAIGIDLVSLGKPKNYSGVIKGNFLKTSFKENEFDAVVVGEVIEHISDILNFLKKLKKVSKRTVIITTPSPYSPSKFYFNYLFPYKRKTNHLFLITPRKMVNLCEIVGLHLKEHIRISDWKQADDLYVLEK